MFESDAKLLVDAINTIFEDCSKFFKHYDEVLVRYVLRSANSVAHTLARAALLSSGLRK